MEPTRKQMSRRGFLVRSLALGATGVHALPAICAAQQTAGTKAKRPVWQIGCYTRPWGQHDYRVALDAIAEAGFRYVGLMTTKSETHLVISRATTPEEAAKVGAEVRKRGLQVPSVYGGDIPAAESVEAAVKALRRLIDNCVAAGAENLMMGGVGDPKVYDAYYKAIAECCDYAAEKRLGISVKPHGGLNATGPQCRKTVGQVGKRNFRLWYDPGNIFYYSDGKLDPVDDAATVDGLVVGMSVKDYLHPRNVDVTPGTGKVDFPKVMARLEKGGFIHGPLVVETLARGDLTATLKEAKKARAFLENLTGTKTPASQP